MIMKPYKIKTSLKDRGFYQIGMILPFQNQPEFHFSWYTFLRIFQSGVPSP
jgi:hypothetical protein